MFVSRVFTLEIKQEKPAVMLAFTILNHFSQPYPLTISSSP